MKNPYKTRRCSECGYALMLALGLLGISTLLLASVVRWTANEAVLTSRNNLYNTTVAAAEAATERVIAQLDRDFIYQSISTDLESYRTLLPVQSDWPVQFRFRDADGNTDRSDLLSQGATVVTNLDSEFLGLYGLVAPYQVTAQAEALDEPFDIRARVSQSFQLARIPIFQFAIFYTMDLEINPGAPMIITGKAHSNGDIYTAPPASLTYRDAVMAAGRIHNKRHPNDPTPGNKTQPVFESKRMDQVSALTLPIGSDNSPAAVSQILDVAPAGEDPTSPLSRQRFANNADLIITTSATGVITVQSGRWNQLTPVSRDAGTGANTYYSFVTNVSFYDYRERKTVRATQLDVAKLRVWMANTGTLGGAGINNQAKGVMNHELNSVYINDLRTPSTTAVPAVRVINGSQLPNDGFTVATPQPLYVKGDFNLNNATTTPGHADTSKTKPAALIGDAITILSANWSDSYGSGTGLNSRPAVHTTVNAAFLAGIVPSTQAGNTKHYSGGVENFPRFLENWSGDTLTYNGSMVVMFPSRFAKSFWVAPGTYYNAPTRKWAFDINFLDPNKLPPLTPQVRKLVRGQWQVLPPV